MKIIDRYILGKFLGTFVYAVLLFSAVAIVIDLTEKIDNFLDKDIPLQEIIFGHYLNFIPYIDALLMPLFVFITVIFFTSRLTNRSELLAMVGSGVSFYRILVPYLVGALIIASSLFVFNHYLVPKANKGRLAFQYTYISTIVRSLKRNVHLQVSPTEYMYVENYSMQDSLGYKFSYEVVQDNRITYKLRADRMKWNTKKGQWEFRNYTERTFNRGKETLAQGKQLDSLFNFYPKDMEFRTSLREEMTTPQLKEYIAVLEARGADYLDFYYIELYRRTANAYTVLILTIIGFVISSRKVRGGIGVQLVAGIVLGLLYIIFERFSTTFSTNGDLDPFLGVWLPNFVFTIICVVMLLRAPK